MVISVLPSCWCRSLRRPTYADQPGASESTRGPARGRGRQRARTGAGRTIRNQSAIGGSGRDGLTVAAYAGEGITPGDGVVALLLADAASDAAGAMPQTGRRRPGRGDRAHRVAIRLVLGEVIALLGEVPRPAVYQFAQRLPG